MRRSFSGVMLSVCLASIPAHAADRVPEPPDCAPRVACQPHVAKPRAKPAKPAPSACMEAARLEAALLLLDPDVDWFHGRCPTPLILEEDEDDEE